MSSVEQQEQTQMMQHVEDMAGDSVAKPQKHQGGGRRGTNALVAAVPTPFRNRGSKDSSKDLGKYRGDAGVAASECAKGQQESKSKSGGSAASGGLEEIMRRRGVEEAWTALEDMQCRGATTDKFTVSRMLMKTVGDGKARLNPARVYRAICLVERFIEQQPKDVDEVLFNALLDTCCRLKDLNRLESTVSKMKEINVQPSPVTLGILVKTYGQAGDMQKVLQVWEDMETQRGQANAVTYGCMIDACVKCGSLAKAVEVFAQMRAAGKHRNTILYTTLIKGHGLDKDLASALKLFREMPDEGVPYNTITYNSVMDACVKCGDLATAESLLRELTSVGSTLQPDLITFSTLLKGYCHVGDLDKALQVIEAIKARGLRCDELVYNTLMDGCVKANDITAGVGLFEEMVQQGMRPSTITHSILARLYHRAGYEDDAAEAVAQLYQNHGLERPIGADRAKGFGRRGGTQRSPTGDKAGSGRNSMNPSPTSSPASTTSLGLHRDMCSLPDAGCSNTAWGTIPMMPGYGDNNAPSMSSTPLGSPIASPVHSNQGFAPFLPMDSRGPGDVPPMPGSVSQDASFRVATMSPINSMPSASFCSGVAGGSPSFGCAASFCSASPVYGGFDQQLGFGMQMPTPAAGQSATMQQVPAWPVDTSVCVPGGLQGPPSCASPCGATLQQMMMPTSSHFPGGGQVHAALPGQVPGQIQAPAPQGMSVPSAPFQPQS